MDVCCEKNDGIEFWSQGYSEYPIAVEFMRAVEYVTAVEYFVESKDDVSYRTLVFG